MLFIFLFIPLFNSLLLLILGFLLQRKGIVFLNYLLLFIQFIIGFYLIYNVIILNNIYIIKFNWFLMFNITWYFQCDTLTALMFFLILIVSNIVNIYSLSYMKSDPYLIKFLSFLSLFTFFMYILVSSGNFIQLFLGWEGVGLCSFLLITFWNTRFEAIKSGLKAMIYNKIGDIGLLIGICLIYINFKTLNFLTLSDLIPFFKNLTIFILWYEFYLIDIISFFLFIGVMGKSAQLGLHLWLPDAMEGPTPVSALIHAATMVTAGVFLLIRCSFIFEYTENILFLIIIFGLLTSFFGAIVGIFQNDLKKIIAYSTCSQLGYMVFACGLSNYNIALFHLINHGFFKALLFLSAGTIIHNINNEQDIRKMGGLLKILPLTFIFFLQGSYSLLGLPFFSGFFSKDLIIELTLGTFKISNIWMFFFSVLSAIFTLLYSLKLIYFVFFTKTKRSLKNLIKIHENNLIINILLSFLCLLAIFSGFFFFDFFININTLLYNNIIFILPKNLSFFETEQINFLIKIIPLIISIIFSFFFFFSKLISFKFINSFKNINLKKQKNKKSKNYFSYLFIYKIKIYKKFKLFFINKWFFDTIFNYISLLFLNIGSFLFKFLDKGIIELIGPIFIKKNLLKYSNKSIKFFENELLINYIFFVLFSLFVVLSFLLFII